MQIEVEKRQFSTVQLLQPCVPVDACLVSQVALQVNDVRYYKLDLKQSLASQLEHKTVIEFPTLLVLLPHQVPDYNLIGDSSGTSTSLSYVLICSLLPRKAPSKDLFRTAVSFLTHKSKKLGTSARAKTQSDQRANR